MISHYTLYDTANVSSRFHIEAGLPKGVKPHYNITPTKYAPVIIGGDTAPVVTLMNWGIVAHGAKDTNSVFRYKTYNTSSERIFSRHSWEQAIRERRCLIPANGFYILNEGDEKQAYYAQPKGESLCAFAGIYSSWSDAEGSTHSSFSILTTEATTDMPDPNGRIPLIVDTKDEARWLDQAITDSSSLYSMLRPNPSDILNVYEISPDVYSPKLNQPSLIAAI